MCQAQQIDKVYIDYKITLCIIELMKKKPKTRFNLTYDLATRQWLDNGVPVERNGEHRTHKPIATMKAA